MTERFAGLGELEKSSFSTKIAIVGTSKLTETEKESVSLYIETILRRNPDALIITGDATGVDELVRIWTPRDRLSVEPAKSKQWDSDDGFKERNLRIANRSDYVYSISTKMKIKPCYHCKIGNHERTGGCYVLKHMVNVLKKKGELIII